MRAEAASPRTSLFLLRYTYPISMWSDIQLIDTLLFDLDGTLIDSHIALSSAANAVREQRGLTPLPIEMLREASLITTPQLLSVAFSISPTDPEYPEIQTAYLQEYCNNIHKTSMLFPGIVDILSLLNTHGIPWGIVTNKMRSPTLRYLTPDSPLSALKTLVCYDDVPNPKPAPDSLRRALEELDHPKHCWYVGDQPIDVMAARSAGIPSVAANWTHTAHTKPDWAKYQPDYICDTVSDLNHLIRSHLKVS